MKKSIILSLIAMLFCVQIQAQTDSAFFGKWVNISDEVDSIFMEFKSNHRVMLYDKNIAMGDDTFKVETTPALMKFKTDYTTSPYQIDIDFVNKTTYEKLFSFIGIFKFIDNNTLYLLISEDASAGRPSSFSEPSDAELKIFKRL